MLTNRNTYLRVTYPRDIHYLFAGVVCVCVVLCSCSIRYGIGSLESGTHAGSLEQGASAQVGYQILAFGWTLDFEYARFRAEIETSYFDLDVSGPNVATSEKSPANATGLFLSGEIPVVTLWNWEEGSAFQYPPLHPERLGIDLVISGSAGYLSSDSGDLVAAAGGALEIHVTDTLVVHLTCEYRFHEMTVVNWVIHGNTWVEERWEAPLDGWVAGVMLRYPAVAFFDVLEHF